MLRLRFLVTTESDVPGYPFMAGQEIAVLQPSAAMRQAMRNGHAVVVSEEPELAVVGVTERAVTRRGRRRAR